MARLTRTFRVMAAVHALGLPRTLRTWFAAARATVFRVIGRPAAACLFKFLTVRRTIVGTARTAGRVTRRRRRMRVRIAVPRTR